MNTRTESVHNSYYIQAPNKNNLMAMDSTANNNVKRHNFIHEHEHLTTCCYCLAMVGMYLLRVILFGMFLRLNICTVGIYKYEFCVCCFLVLYCWNHTFCLCFSDFFYISFCWNSVICT